MGASNEFLLLIPPLIILFVVGFMIGWEIGLASGTLAALVYCFGEASKPNASPLFLVGGIVFIIVFGLTSYDSIRRILANRTLLEKRNRLLGDLSNKRFMGTSLLNEGIEMARGRNNDIDSWWHKVEDWRKEAHTILHQINPTEANNWNTLGDYESRSYGFGGYETHIDDKLSQLSAWLNKLERYIDAKSKS